MPEPRPKASMSTRPVGTPQQAAMLRFCVTARTFRPRRVRFSSSQVSTSTQRAKPMMTMRFHGSTRLGSTWMPPDSHAGLATSTFCAPNSTRTSWISTRLMPQVASRVSSGRP
ncbi:hypothetical protein D9M71_516660 [compost metagenome]